jgi:ABC-2 type transport system ATP-binding protein
MNAIIETRGLSRCFGRFKPVEAVHDLDLTIPEGSICAFLGPNGAGKTTTIKLLMNLLRPTGGTARVLGTDARRLGPAQWQQIGYVSENQHLHEWMTVQQLLDYCRPFYPTWDDAFAKKLLADFALPPDRKIKHLSRGMKMKASLLSSIAYRPRLLVLDEPFSGLDPLARDELLSGMLELTTQEKWTIFVSSHDVDEVERLADWVAILNGGRLLLSEPVADLQTRFRRIELILSDPRESLPTLPPTWLGAEHAERVIRATVTDFREAETESIARALFPPLQSFTAAPMSLREIFIALARAHRLPT